MLYLPIKIKIVITFSLDVAVRQGQLNPISFANEQAFITIDVTADNKPVISEATCKCCGNCTSRCHRDVMQTGYVPVTVDFCFQNSELKGACMAESFGIPLPKALKTMATPCAERWTSTASCAH